MNTLNEIEWVRDYLVNIEQAKTIAPNHTKLINFKCPDCNREKEMKPRDLMYRGFSCPLCSTGTSFPELFFISYLEVKNINYEYQKVFKALPNRRFDFYISSIGVCETHGRQHYESSSNISWDVEEIQQSDKEKEEYCIKNEIKYIPLDCRISSFRHIANTINNCKYLPSITEIEELEIRKMMEQNRRYPIQEIIYLYEGGETTTQIGERFKVSYGTVCNILRKNNIEIKGVGRKKKKIRLINTGETFDSAVEASEKYKANKNHISEVCRGKRKSSGKFNGEKLYWEFVS